MPKMKANSAAAQETDLPQHFKQIKIKYDSVSSVTFTLESGKVFTFTQPNPSSNIYNSNKTKHFPLVESKNKIMQPSRSNS